MAVQPARQFRKNFRNGLCRAGGGRNQRLAAGTRPPQIRVPAVDDGLRVGDIDSQRMTLRIEQGKGRKDRYTMLSIKLLDLLRRYWKAVHSQHWLFPGKIPGRHLTRDGAGFVFYQARDAAGIKKKVSIHCLRHSFATHLLESGENIRKVQLLLGHRSLKSTQVYTHVAKDYLENTPSPLDILPDFKDFPPSES